MSANHYEILGVSPEASDDEIRKAYYHLAREFHPDKASSPEEAVAFDERMGIVSAAYNELKDRDRRALYDKALFGTGTRNPSETQQEPAMKPPANPELAPPPPPSVPAKKTATSASITQMSSAGNPDAKITTAKRSFAKGMYLMLNGNPAKAVMFFEAAIQNNDKEPIYYARLAQAMMRSHKSFVRMLEVANKAIELDPYKSDYHMILAEIYEAANMPAKAIDAYQELLKWDPENAHALARLAELKPPENIPFWKKLFGKG
ncbi:MAG: DnaJ domain-containing protein [Candidatus Sumerlaeales bacterium]|nr:DnaJ domain-containing protein [Candidatus Sumerlaeales bacterium]